MKFIQPAWHGYNMPIEMELEDAVELDVPTGACLARFQPAEFLFELQGDDDALAVYRESDRRATAHDDATRELTALARKPGGNPEIYAVDAIEDDPDSFAWVFLPATVVDELRNGLRVKEPEPEETVEETAKGNPESLEADETGAETGAALQKKQATEDSPELGVGDTDGAIDPDKG